jgi:hypothetical protein
MVGLQLFEILFSKKLVSKYRAGNTVAYVLPSFSALYEPSLVISQVTDARATMAIYRLHMKEWEKGYRPMSSAKSKNVRKKAKVGVIGPNDTLEIGR